MAVFAGMIGVTLFGLFLTPVFYAVVHRLARCRTPAPAEGRDQAAPALPVVQAGGPLQVTAHR